MQISIDQARKILKFFWKLDISKSKADDLLNQLANEWQSTYDEICKLIILALVVYLDETGWKVSKKQCYTWIFKSVSETLLVFGRKRNEEVLDEILPRGKFLGTGVTDCYGMYEKYFKTAQKCWPHFLRDMVLLVLNNPRNKSYQIYKDAIELEANEDFSKEEKKEKTKDFEERILKLCKQKDKKLSKKTRKNYRKFVNLQKRLVRNIKALFTFVFTEGVDSHNNLSEQGLRPIAKARNNYQTSKTDNGAKRRSVITSVFRSLSQNLKEFSIENVTEEVIQWRRKNLSLFGARLEALNKVSAKA